MRYDRTRPSPLGRAQALVWALVGAYFLSRWWERGATWHGLVAALLLTATPLLWLLAGQGLSGHVGRLARALLPATTLAWLLTAALDAWALTGRP